MPAALLGRRLALAPGPPVRELRRNLTMGPQDGIRMRRAD